MSDLGGYPPPIPPVPPPPEPTPPPAPAQIPLWVVGVAGAVALAMVGALAFALFGSNGGSSSSPDAAAPSSPGPSYPAHWDHRILPEVRIAERQRGLSFRHPVPVRFLSPPAFRKSLQQDDEVTADDRRKLRQETALLRAFGLVSGKVDLLKAVNDFGGSAVLAYYSFADQRITVRGTTITPSTKATLVHELTHALQDQYFHVGARTKALDKQKEQRDTLGTVLHAIIEGDAERVEHAYGSALPPRQRRALVAAQQREASQARKGLSTVPPFVIALETSPYDLGEGLVRVVAEHGGNAAVGRLFRRPPTHDVALLDPLRFVSGRSRTVPVPRPALPTGAKKFDSGEFGALTWYLMLAARLPALQALRAADGWGGDSYVAYQDRGQTCARADFRGRTPADTAVMEDGLRQWLAAAPGAPDVVSRQGAVVRLESCDPGTAGQAVPGDFESALALDATRTLIGVTLMHSGASVGAARCIAGGLVQTYSVAQLTDPTFGADDPAVQSRIQQIAAGCR
jgi:hypothetical protein